MSNLAGINFPIDGRILWQEDFQFEQDAIGNEVLNRFNDFIGAGVVSGGVVSAGTNPSTVQVSELLAYDDLGRRINVPAEDNIAYSGDVYIFARHVFDVSVDAELVDAYGYATERRSNSGEIVVQASDTLENGVLLGSVVSGVCSDLRAFIDYSLEHFEAGFDVDRL